MSFTAEILKSLVSTDLVKEVVNSDGFKDGLIGFDINDYLTDQVIDTITEKIFSNLNVKKKLRSMITDILSDMGIRDEVDNDRERSEWSERSG